QLFQILEARRVNAEARILRELRPAHRLAKSCKLMVKRTDDEDVAILCLEDTRRNRVPRMQSRTRRYDLALGQAVSFDAGLMIVEVGVEQGEIEILPESRALAIKQRRAHRAHRMNAGADVADRAHYDVRRAVLFAAHRNDSRVRRA